MSWISDYKYAWYETLAMNVLRTRTVPQHIAFIMDGNRRFAKSEDLRKIEGHSKGFDKLADCLRWCLDMGVRMVTTFAFSIENFKRTDEEVNDLMELARQKFEQLLREKDKLHMHGVCIRVIGNLSLLPMELQKLVAKAMLETENNKKLFLNVAFAYSSRDEMANAIDEILTHGNDLGSLDIDEQMLNDCMFLPRNYSPTLIIRTSGETRISDFLMWHLSTTAVYFTKILWPNLTIWNFLAGIFHYQRTCTDLVEFQNSETERLKHISSRSLEVSNTVGRIHNSRRSTLVELSNMQ